MEPAVHARRTPSRFSASHVCFRCQNSATMTDIARGRFWGLLEAVEANLITSRVLRQQVPALEAHVRAEEWLGVRARTAGCMRLLHAACAPFKHRLVSAKVQVRCGCCVACAHADTPAAARSWRQHTCSPHANVCQQVPQERVCARMSCGPPLLSRCSGPTAPHARTCPGPGSCLLLPTGHVRALLLLLLLLPAPHLLPAVPGSPRQCSLLGLHHLVQRVVVCRHARVVLVLEPHHHGIPDAALRREGEMERGGGRCRRWQHADCAGAAAARLLLRLLLRPESPGEPLLVLLVLLALVVLVLAPMAAGASWSSSSLPLPLVAARTWSTDTTFPVWLNQYDSGRSTLTCGGVREAGPVEEELGSRQRAWPCSRGVRHPIPSPTHHGATLWSDLNLFRGGLGGRLPGGGCGGCGRGGAGLLRAHSQHAPLGAGCEGAAHTSGRAGRSMCVGERGRGRREERERGAITHLPSAACCRTHGWRRGTAWWLAGCGPGCVSGKDWKCYMCNRVR